MNRRQIADLIRIREKLRQDKKYDESDKIRDMLADLGFNLQDTPDTTIIEKPHVHSDDKKQLLVIFGSGETSTHGRRVHEEVLSSLNIKNPRIVIISTPAGFQPNVQVVCEDIQQFFLTKLKNYHPVVSIIYANSKENCNNPSLIADINSADYTFMGPGSPTYTIHTLSDTLLLDTIQSRISEGMSMAVSSAAAIACSQYSLPVYEIYKAGLPLYWEKGLNVYSSAYEAMSIIPHCNNTEGGSKFDTSYCYMGKTRFQTLRTMLSSEKKLVGIDEHTALVIDVSKRTSYVKGKGHVRNL